MNHSTGSIVPGIGARGESEESGGRVMGAAEMVRERRGEGEREKEEKRCTMLWDSYDL